MLSTSINWLGCVPRQKKHPCWTHLLSKSASLCLMCWLLLVLLTTVFFVIGDWQEPICPQLWSSSSWMVPSWPANTVGGECCWKVRLSRSAPKGTSSRALYQRWWGVSQKVWTWRLEEVLFGVWQHVSYRGAKSAEETTCVGSAVWQDLVQNNRCSNKDWSSSHQEPWRPDCKILYDPADVKVHMKRSFEFANLCTFSIFQLSKRQISLYSPDWSVGQWTIYFYSPIIFPLFYHLW